MINQSIGYALSVQQEQRWNTARGRDPGRVTLAAQIGPVSEADLRASFARSTARHGIFRTHFFKPQGARQPLQTIDNTVTSVQLEIPSRSAEGKLALRLTADSLNADVETLRLLLRDIVEGLNGEANTHGAPFEYLNVSEWQHDLLDSSDAEEALAWWRSKIDAVKGERPYTARREGSGAQKSVPFVCPAAFTSAARAGNWEASVSEILLSSWLLTQRFFTGLPQQSVVYRFDGRFTPELREVVGPLSHFLPLNLEWSENQSFEDFFRSVRFAVEEAADRQEYFYPAAIGRDDPLRSGRLPGYLFSERQGRFGIGEIQVVIVEEEEPLPVCCWCALQIVRDEQGLKGWLHYDEDELSNIAATFMLDSFLTCLESYAANPRQLIARLRPLSDAAQRDLLRNSAQGDVNWVREMEPVLVPARILENVRHAPKQVAVICGPRRLSYGELGGYAAKVAATLRAFGIGPEIPVGIAIRSSAEAMVAMLAVLQAGGIYVPLAPDDPPARFEKLLRDLDISVVVIAGDVGAFAPANVRVIRIDLDDPTRENLEPVLAPSVPDHGAYVIHTSGSTGEARAVLVSHGTLLASTLARRHFYGAPVRRFLLVSPLTFDSSIAGLFWTLVDGGTLILPQEVPANTEELLRLIAEHRVSHLLCIPRLLEAITEGAGSGELDSLDTAIVAGEACPGEIAREFLAAVPNCALYNEYGVTEAGVWSTVHRVSSEDAEGSVPIGRAIPGAHPYICSQELDLLPVGAVGELCIGGTSLARGYAGRPAVTAERFVPDPYATSPGARLYRTGDRVRSADGRTLVFVGRADNCVKIRGQRIELEQLEAIIRQELPVAEVAVVVDHRTTSPGLAVCYTNRAGEDVMAEQIRTALAARLPKGLAPEHIVRADELPRTATGKLDRRRIEEVIRAGAVRAAGSPPRTALERKLAEIWGPLLGVAEISRDDDFLALGGDSIISLQITSRARSAGLTMTPRQVMSCRTVAALAAEIERTPAAQAPSVAVSNSLTPIQRWFFAQEFADPQHYDQAVVMEAGADLDMEVLRGALQAVVVAHAALQTGFVRDGQGWRAYHDPEAQEVSVHVLDGAAVDSRDSVRLIREALLGGQGSFDLARPPLLRMLVVNGGNGRSSRMVFLAHHLIVDGVSWRILFDDLAAAYDAIRRSESPTLAGEFVTPGQWADRLADRAQDPRVRALTAYWQEDRDDAAWQLPIDYPEGGNRESDAATMRLVLKPEYALTLMRSDEELLPDAAILSALTRALAEWHGRDALWISIENHGREAAEDLDLSRTIGWFTAVAPVRLKCDRSLAMLDQVAEIREQLQQKPVDAWLFDYLRYSETGAESERLSALPPAPVSFNNLGPVHTTALPQLPLTLLPDACEPLRSLAAHRNHLIDVTVSSVDEVLSIVITYSAALHARRTIERIGERMLAMLEQMCAVEV